MAAEDRRQNCCDRLIRARSQWHATCEFETRSSRPSGVSVGVLDIPRIQTRPHPAYP
ncbi:hypothetical protein [Baaleninema simplex]|uniref:hypothetical protein n=1 Tax=Baaleninema simplex TaxID=2862350 RepID=UPI00130E46ED|nr:hypothetical protein [Baaleninema simplex]